jgi:predicted thioesterase
MIMVMENAALNAIRAYLDPGESAVGTAVNCAISRRRRLDAWSPGTPR